jgi:adenylylsulfate kinase
MESNARSVAKAVSYRVMGSMVTALIVFVYSGDAKASMGVGAADMFLKMALYYIHERLWNYIPFGRPRPPEYEI